MKNGDFVKLNYTGRLEDGTVFDTTDPATAKTANMQADVQPVTICIGEKMLIPGLDEALTSEKDKQFTTIVPAEKAFGKKDTKLLRVIPTQQLSKQKIQPYPGMQLNIDNNYGIVKTTGGGRTVVDFNHPLAGKDVSYEVEVLDEKISTNAKVAALLKASSVPYKTITVKEKHATVQFEQMLPEPMLNIIQETIKRLTDITTVSFENI
ncbi:MAG: peptidylprolyl isomerase [Candidatus Woesearchaeota archaeon]|nr:peptidylprolyl isomerase [Candidatus Woesearchaeota archaeon]